MTVWWAMTGPDRLCEPPIGRAIHTADATQYRGANGCLERLFALRPRKTKRMNSAITERDKELTRAFRANSVSRQGERNQGLVE